jgi:hypothetical protein
MLCIKANKRGYYDTELKSLPIWEELRFTIITPELIVDATFVDARFNAKAQPIS